MAAFSQNRDNHVSYTNAGHSYTLLDQLGQFQIFKENPVMWKSFTVWYSVKIMSKGKG